MSTSTTQDAPEVPPVDDVRQPAGWAPVVSAGRWLSLGLVIVILGSALVAIGGASPLDAWQAIFAGSFGSLRSLGETLIRFAPLAVIAAGLAPSLQAGLFNIGAPGQMGAGALAATVVSLGLAGASAPLLITLSAVAGVIGGILWTLIPALLRAKLAVNEILTTFVFNFIAVGLLGFLLNGPLAAERATIPQSEALPQAALIPIMVPGTRAHAGILLGLAAVVALFVMSKTPIGYRIRLYGGRPTLAVRAGVREARFVTWLLLLGGGTAGLAGWMQVAGVDQRLYPTIAAVVGFNGLFVALLGRMRASGILLASLLFAALLKGGESLQVSSSVSPELINALIGLTVLVFVMQGVTRRRRSMARGSA